MLLAFLYILPIQLEEYGACTRKVIDQCDVSCTIETMLQLVSVKILKNCCTGYCSTGKLA